MGKKWFKDGLAFSCQGCGECCRGPGGYVWLTEEEAQAIAEFLNMDEKKFYKKYIKNAKGKLAIVDDYEDNCIFLDNEKNACEIYDVRPTQCRTFPWWPELLRSKEVWDCNSYDCPGINKGDIYPVDEIENKAKLK